MVLLMAGGYLGVKKMIRKAESTHEAMVAVTDRFGRISQFTPSPSGVVDPGRVEAFLDVRARASEARGRLESTLAQLSHVETDGPSSSMDAARSVRAGVAIIPQMMGYVNRRNEAFLDAGMGLGEYLHLYVLIYGSWLEKPIHDGPPFVLIGGEMRFDGSSEADIQRTRSDEIRRRINRTLLPVLRNQLEAAISLEGDLEAPWIESLRTEVLLVESDPQRIPWQDGLPEHTARSLQPYWERLDASYSALCHPVEFAVMQD
jgi:hypothetical protein